MVLPRRGLALFLILLAYSDGYSEKRDSQTLFVQGFQKHQHQHQHRHQRRYRHPGMKTVLRLYSVHDEHSDSFDSSSASSRSSADSSLFTSSPYQSAPAPAWAPFLDEKITIPIVIMDAILPNQTLHFSSPDPKFDALIQHVFSTHESEIGILGLDPPTKLPLNVGVTAPIVKQDVIFGVNATGERILATSLKGKRRFQIVGEPWMDRTESFYIAQVQIIDHRPESILLEQHKELICLHNKIPSLVNEWVESLIETEKLSPAGVIKILKQSGTMPSEPRNRAIFVASLLNPTIPLGLCQEIRPAMLSCRNDHERMVLASVALRSSIDLLWKDRNK